MGFLGEISTNTINAVKYKIREATLNPKANEAAEKEKVSAFADPAPTATATTATATTVTDVPPPADESAADGPKTIVSTAVRAFFTTILVMALIFIGLLAGRIVACDVIHRAPIIRLLHFIYGAVFFPVVVPYYLYRYYKGTFPYTGYGLLPLKVGPTDNFFLKLFSYEPDENVSRKAEHFMATGRALIA